MSDWHKYVVYGSFLLKIQMKWYQVKPARLLFTGAGLCKSPDTYANLIGSAKK